MVQVEAMMCGVPVVASDLPGVRTIVQTTAMGCVCKRRDPQDLASCIADVLDHPDDYRKPRDFILSCYSTPKTTQTYLDIMNMQGQ